MLTAELDFLLPPHLIAQKPASPRDHSRLMVLQREDQKISNHRFDELPQLLRAGDLLVFNDTRVLHARLRGRKVESGGRVEALLLRQREINLWEALLKPSARLRPGSPLEFRNESTPGQVCVRAEPVERSGEGWLLRFQGETDIRELLPQLGELPTPPYIKRRLRNEAEYQTIFARSDNAELDSAAAPTAGLHFTPRLLESLRARDIRTAFITLGVGVGTFRPVQSQTLEEHTMHREEYSVPEETALLVNAQRENGGRVVAVGTTATRVLESIADEEGRIRAGAGSTDIFIRPGYRFRCADALLTNFHLPRSSLLAMIGAFADLDFIHQAYRHAIAAEYRFFSFGDAMLIE